MAFEATHVRFARDLAPSLQIHDLPAYFAGCVYPDSRYMTGIPREHTHGLRRVTSLSTDFEKGWFTHLLYDELVGPCYLRTSIHAGQTLSAWSEAWISMTAAKLIEDRQSCALIPVAELFASLEPPVPSPMQENPERLQAYYRLQQRLYRETPSIDGYRALFSAFRLPEPVADALAQRAREFLSNEAKCAEITGFYAPALRQGMERVQRPMPETHSD